MGFWLKMLEGPQARSGGLQGRTTIRGEEHDNTRIVDDHPRSDVRVGCTQSESGAISSRCRHDVPFYFRVPEGSVWVAEKGRLRRLRVGPE